MKKKVHLSVPETGKTICGIRMTANVLTTEMVGDATCKTCERITTAPLAGA